MSQSFIIECYKEQIIIRDILRLANELHFDVIVKNVGKQEQLDYLKSVYCRKT